MANVHTGTRRTSSRGFASMNEEKQREIARMGGRAAHEKGTAHEFTPEEAREAGRKGGEAVSHSSVWPDSHGSSASPAEPSDPASRAIAVIPKATIASTAPRSEM